MKYKVLSGTLTHNGEDYLEGSLVELDSNKAEKLVADKIISQVDLKSDTPNDKWKVDDIKSWLKEKQVEFADNAVKKDLLLAVEKYLEDNKGK